MTCRKRKKQKPPQNPTLLLLFSFASFSAKNSKKIERVSFHFKNVNVQAFVIKAASQMEVILEIFTGLGMLGIGFKEAGFCVVPAGDILFGSHHDIRGFHAPPNKFDGVISFQK